MAICAVEKAFRPTTSHPSVSHLTDLTCFPNLAIKAHLDKVDQMPGSAGSQSIQKNCGSISDVPLYARKGSKWNRYVLSKELAPNVYLAHDDLAQKVVIKKLPHKAGCSGLPKETLAGLILVLEFIEGKDLFSFVQQRQFAPLDEEEARHMFIQLLEAVSYSHSVGVAHLDIKLENIILSSNSTVKLIDFGLCDIVKSASDVIQCWVGSLDYACPEIYLRKPYEASKADVFSLGVVLYILLSGELPFSREERTDCLRLFGKHPQIIWPSQCKASPEAKDLLLRMTEFNGEQRISLDDIFHHKWVKLPLLDD